MPHQILIQDVKQFHALQNLGGDIGDIKRWFINWFCIVCEKKVMWRQHIFERQSYMADDIVTNTIMAAPDTRLGVVKIGFIIYKLAEHTS